MAKQDTSALVEAAAAFDSELATYTRLGKLFISTPLGSVKHLERANQTLGEIAASEEKLQAAGTALAQALGGVRAQQERTRSYRAVVHLEAAALAVVLVAAFDHWLTHEFAQTARGRDVTRLHR